MPFTLTGAQIRELRLSVGVTQADLARRLGYSRYAISKWERSPDKSIPRTQYQPVLDYLIERHTAADVQRAKAASLASLQHAVHQ